MDIYILPILLIILFSTLLSICFSLFWYKGSKENRLSSFQPEHEVSIPFCFYIYFPHTESFHLALHHLLMEGEDAIGPKKHLLFSMAFISFLFYSNDKNITNKCKAVGHSFVVMM